MIAAFTEYLIMHIIFPICPFYFFLRTKCT